jgi:drug/metabolite transporter (DMT)-like permease
VERWKKKILGVCLAFVGVLVARLEHFIPLQPSFRNPIYFLGVLVALAGLAVFTSGMSRER